MTIYSLTANQANTKTQRDDDEGETEKEEEICQNQKERNNTHYIHKWKKTSVPTRCLDTSSINTSIRSLNR